MKLEKIIFKQSLSQSKDFNIIKSDEQNKIIIEKKPDTYRRFNCSIVIDTAPNVFSHTRVTCIEYDKKDNEIRVTRDTIMNTLTHTVELGINSTVELYDIGKETILIVINEIGVPK